MDIQQGIYRHFKGGTYEVIGVAYHSEDLNKMVVYKSLRETEQFPMGTLWVRPKELFVDTVKQDGIFVTRFTKI